MPTVHLTTQDVARFKGGHMEIISNGCMYYGPIASILIDERSVLRVTFVWLAKGEGKPFPKAWFESSRRGHATDLTSYMAMSIDAGTGKGFYLRSPKVRDTIILFPPGNSKLAYKDVRKPVHART